MGGSYNPLVGRVGEVWGWKISRKKMVHFLLFFVFVLVVFWHMIFSDGFIISIKELGLFTNMGQWIRGLDVA
jgi:hypothetical protein